MTAAVPTSRDRKGSSNIVLLLSLMLILLAFFILLNSLSEFEAGKAQAVIEIVNRATASFELGRPVEYADRNDWL